MSFFPAITTAKLDPLVNIPSISWYTRLEMALSLALQLQELHKRGMVMGDITLKHVFTTKEQKVFLHPPLKNTNDASKDVLLLGCTIFELLFFKTAPWRKRDYKKDELDVVHKMLHEYPFVRDDEAALFVVRWMCHPDETKRFSLDTAIYWLRQICEENHDALLYAFTPDSKASIPINLIERKPEEIGNIVEELFKGCVQNAYISRKRFKLAHKIIYLGNHIIFLPKKNKDEDNHHEWMHKHGRPVKVLKKEDGCWHDVSLYAFSSNKAHIYKTGARKERALQELLAPKQVVAKRLLALSFAQKPDKLLTLYEEPPMLTVEDKVDAAYKIIKAVAILRKKGIIHREITAENILITSEGKVQFCDMRSAVRDVIWQGCPDRLSNELYLAPERYAENCTGSWEPQAIYSLGCLLYILIESKWLPWERKNGYSVIDKKQSLEKDADEAKAKLQSALTLDSNSTLSALIYWMLHPKPEKRATWDDISKIILIV